MRINKIIFFALLFAFVSLVNAQTNWTGNVDSDWDDAGNWSAGIPDASDAVNIPDVTNDPVINIPGAVCGALTIESAGKLTSNNNGGSYDLTANSINILSGGQLLITNGEVTSGNFTHTGVLSITGGTLDINGHYTSSGNVVANITSGTIEISGNWDGTSGSGFDPSGGTVFFNGGTQAISTHASNYFHDLTIGGTTNTKTCLLYTSPSPRDVEEARMPSSA